MALSITQLSIYLTGRDFSSSKQNTSWSNTEEMDQDLPWNGLSCLSVVSYVLKFCSSTDHKDVFQAIKRLDVFATEINKAALDEWELAERNQQFAETFVDTFMPKVKKFFTLPEPESSTHLAAFLHFLLQVLNSESDHIQLTDSIALKGGLKHLRETLSFFLAVLGDTMFRYVELEEVKILLMGFKAMANEAGRFVYSSVFHTSPDNISSLRVEKVDFLNVEIEEVCNKFQKLPQSMSVDPVNTDVADALLTVNSLLEDLETFLTPRVDLIGHLKDQTSNLKNELVSAQSFLKDVNASRETETDQVRECISQIREASCEADYLINSFVVGNFPQWYLSIRIPHVILKLELIGKRFNAIRSTYGINVRKLEKDLPSQGTPLAVNDENDLPSQGTPLAVIDDIFVGFQSETQEVLGQLILGSSDLQTISIHGMPGLGKTTFARYLYNHRGTTGHFDLSAWCVVSQTYQRRRVLIDILMGLRKLHSSDEIMKMKDHMLIEGIHKTLKGRRFFIIMDDIWATDCLDDARLFCPNDDRNGSRILFTTRNQGTTKNSIARTLPLLTDVQCWELIERKVFHYKDCPEELVNYGKQIAKKCSGLPLTVVVIAGILASMSKEKNEWRKVENSINTYTRDSMNVLELSYKHLPNHLKLCFLCFGLFPGDAQIDVKRLICSWIAEGFIQKDEHRSQEDLAREYFKHLVERSLVQVTKYGSTGSAKACSIHDVLREMCKERAKEENFMSFIEGDDVSIYERHLRLSVSPANPTSLRPFSVHCRSFYGHLSDPSSCLPQMKHLRIMQLHPNEGVNISYKLKQIEMLVHLKYLVLDRMPQVRLDNLVNLEILVVDTNLNTVPVSSRILKMGKLRHLNIKRHAKFEHDYDSSQPNNLQYLSFMTIHSTKDYKILESSPHLRKLKCLCPPQLPDFRFLSKLESLNIMIRTSSRVPNAVEINFPSTIRKLSLSGTRLPWEMMSIIGRLPNLQSLKLLWKAFIGKEWETTEDEFQKLIFLKLDGLKLEQWTTSSSNFPILEHLVLSKCDELLDIPLEIGEVPTLKTIEVRDCSDGALTSATQIEKEQLDYGNDLKFITTDGSKASDIPPL